MKVFWSVILYFVLVTVPVPAQGDDECWQLTNKIWSENISKPDKMPRALQSIDEIASKFLEKVDKTKMTGKIFISFIVDDFGDVKCPKIEKGNLNETDVAAMKYVLTLKFKPAEHEGKRIPFRMTLPLPRPELKYEKHRI